MNKQLVVFLLVSLSLVSSCYSPHSSIKSNYDFSRIDQIAVWGINDFTGFKGTGESVMGEVALCITKAGYSVIERVKIDILIKEKTLAQEGLTQANLLKVGQLAGVNAILTGSIIEYQPQKILTLPVDIEQKGDERIEQYFDSNSGRQIPMKLRSGSVRTRKMEVKALEASFGLHLRLLDVNSGVLIWGGTYSYSGMSMTRVITETVTRLTSTLPRHKSDGN